MTAKLFEAALGIAAPWSVSSVEFDEKLKALTLRIDFKAGSKFEVSGHAGAHGVHDTQTKRYRHLNFFEHECHLEVRTPRVKLPNGSIRLVEPDFAGRLNGFTLLFEALVLMLAQQMPFAAVSRIVGESAHRVTAVCSKYVEIACGLADYSDVTALAVDETSRARGHSYVTLAADAEQRRVLFVAEGRGAGTIEELAEYLEGHGGAALYCRGRGAPAQWRDHVRQVPRDRPCQLGSGQDAAHRAAHRQVLEGHALDLAERHQPSEARGGGRSGCTDRQDDRQAHGACLGLQGTAA